MKATKIYLAGPLFTDEQKEVIFKINDFLMEDERFEVFSPFHASQDIWKGRAPKDCTDEDRQAVFYGNWQNVDWCDVLLAWIGGGPKTDTGVSWEMGYAYHKKPILVYIDDNDERQAMNLMLERAVDGVARGFEDLKDGLIWYHKYKDTAERVLSKHQTLFPPDMIIDGLVPEQEPVV